MIQSDYTGSQTKNFKNMKKQTRSVALILIAISSWLVFGTAFVGATNYKAQIKVLREQAEAQRVKQQRLETSAHTIEDTLKILRHRIVTVRRQIGANEQKSAQLKVSIKKQKIEIAKQRKVLGINIRHMYLDGQTSTIEKLASSKDLSEYVDKEQYRVSVQDKIQSTLKRIKTLEKKLAAEKVEVDKLLEDQKVMRTELAGDQSQRRDILSLNKKQQRAYNSNIAKNNAQIAELRRQQAAENARGVIGGTSYVGTGSYPWSGVPFPNAMSDPWGMYKRQCVSYAAWKVASTGRHMPYWGGRGNANLWDDNARAAGIPVDYSPRVGDVAVSNSGYYGHVMYVEQVHGDGTITISQYNGDWTGRYSVARRSTAGLVFIHF